jgi:hypothetical protein
VCGRSTRSLAVDEPGARYNLKLRNGDRPRGKIERLEQEIRALSAEELTALRRWFIEYDAEAWDREIEADVKSGKLDRLAEEALRDHAEGRTKRL